MYCKSRNQLKIYKSLGKVIHLFRNLLAFLRSAFLVCLTTIFLHAGVSGPVLSAAQVHLRGDFSSGIYVLILEPFLKITEGAKKWISCAGKFALTKRDVVMFGSLFDCEQISLCRSGA